MDRRQRCVKDDSSFVCFLGGIAFRDFIFRAESPLAFACQGETDLIGAAVIGAVLACRKLKKAFIFSLQQPIQHRSPKLSRDAGSGSFLCCNRVG